MNDAFRITVHWSDRIIEVRFPRNPTVASYARCHEEVKLAVARIGKPWMALTDDTGVEVMPPALLQVVAASVEWSLAHGLVRAASVTRFEGEIAGRIGDFVAEAKFPKGIGLRFATRDEAWAALLLPGKTPANGMKAFSLTSS